MINRYANVLLCISAAGLGLAASASAIPNIIWQVVLIISFLLAVVANTIRAKQYPLSRNILVSGSVGSAAALVLIVVFSAYAFGGDEVFLEAHLFGRAVPWWLGILVVMAAFFAMFALSAALGHVVNAKLRDS